MKCIECKHDNRDTETNFLLQINDKEFPLCSYHLKVIEMVCVMKGVKYDEKKRDTTLD